MATTFVDYTGDGNATKVFSFPSYQESDVKVRVDGVLKDTSTHYNITGYTTTGGGNVVFTSGNIPSSPAKIRIYRDTNVDAAKATFTAGSSVKAADLNNNTTQLLYRAQEEQVPNLIQAYDIDDSAITTTKIATDAVSNAKLAENSVDSENYVDGSIDTVHIGDAQITTAKLAADSVTGAKIGDDQINSEHYADGSIDTAHIADLNITTAKIANSAVNGPKIATGSVSHTKLAANAVETDNIADAQITTAKIVDSNVTTAKIADSNVTTAKLAADAVTNAKIADDSINSEHYVDGSIDTQHIADSNITTAKIADSNVTTAKIADANITNAKIANNAVTGAKLSTNSVGNGMIVAAAVSTEKIANAAVTTVKIANDAVTTGKIADSELKTLAGMQSGTASKLAASTALTADIADLNQIDGMAKQTTITDDDTKFPTSGAVVDYVAAQIAPLGGLEVIANEVSFPNTQPSSGVVISISDTGGVVVNGSGVSTTGRTVGGSTVTINGFPSSLQNKTMANSLGLMVSSTGSGQVYNYHKLLAKEADVEQLSNDINDFAARYRVGSSNPTTDLDSGDLFFNTGTGKLLVYNGTNSAWEEAQSIGNFFINTLSSSSGTGGGSATPNGSAYRFTLSNAGTVAQQHIVSVDGVVQKPNSGSSQPSEGFAIDGADIIFGAAPVSGASIFVVTSGSTVNIGTPSNNTVTSAILQNGSVTTAKIVDANVTTAKIADAAVTNAKIGDNAISTTKISNNQITGAKMAAGAVGTLQLADGAVTGAKLASGAADLVSDTSPQLGGDLASNGNDILIADSDFIKFGTGNDLTIKHNGTHSVIENFTNNLYIGGSTSGQIILQKAGGDVLAKFISGAQSELYFDNSKKLATASDGITVTGRIVADELDMTDGDKIKLGNGDDAEFFHNGASNNTEINHSNNSGHMQIASNRLKLTNYDGPETYIDCISNGAVNLYHNNSNKFQTTSTGVHVDGELIVDGSVGDIKLNSSGAEIDFNRNGPCNLIMSGSGVFNILGGTPGSADTLAKFTPNGSVELYHNNVKTLETTAAGAKLTHQLEFHSSTDNIRWPEHATGTNSRAWDIIGEQGSYGVLDIKYANARGETPNEISARFVANGAVQLYHNGTRIVSTASYGMQFDSGHDLQLPDDGRINLGNAGDFSLKHDATDNHITLDQTLNIDYAAGTKMGAKFIPNAAVELYYNNGKKFETTGAGVKVTGDGEVIRMEGADNDTFIKLLGSSNVNVIFGHLNDQGFVGNSTNHDFFIRTNNTNRISISNSGTLSGDLNDTSDGNLKENIVAISDGAISDIKKLRPVNFDWKDSEKAKNQSGFIAQEVKTIFPNLVVGEEYDESNEESFGFAINTSGVVAHLTKALQEAITKIETLETKVAALEAA